MPFDFKKPLEPIDTTEMYLQIIQDNSSEFFVLTHMVSIRCQEPITSDQQPSVFLMISGDNEPYQIYVGPESAEIYEFIIRARLKNQRYVCVDLILGKMKFWSFDRVIRNKSIPRIGNDSSTSTDDNQS